MTKGEPRHRLPELGPGLYAQWRRADIGLITEHLERALVLDLAGPVVGEDVLDVGCGDGDLALDLWQRGARVSGIDASFEMIAAAHERARRHSAAIAFEVGRAEQLPYASESFDLVLAVTILCFVANAGPVFRELARVLRPDGRLVIGELGRWSSWAAARRIRAWRGSALWKKARFRTKSELCRLAEAAGLEVEVARGAIFYPRCAAAARLLAPMDAAFGRLTTLGAAFIALSASKPGLENRPD
jgi:2-polyprenyl-3-methyl-5-hydroxy-6-metoxy-1,4-benzoquinol methylase